jgi:hypothetical protein
MVAHKVTIENNSDIKWTLDYEINSELYWIELKNCEYHKNTECVSLYREVVINGCYQHKYVPIIFLNVICDITVFQHDIYNTWKLN